MFSSSFIKIEAMWSKMHNLSRGDMPYRYAGTVCRSGSFAELYGAMRSSLYVSSRITLCVVVLDPFSLIVAF